MKMTPNIKKSKMKIQKNILKKNIMKINNLEMINFKDWKNTIKKIKNKLKNKIRLIIKKKRKY